jgi:Protein of unknown function (DUF2934)
MDADLDERIRRRAYELWEREGRPEGRALDHWRRAEAEVAGDPPGAGGDHRGGRVREPSDLAADEAAEGGGGVGP